MISVLRHLNSKPLIWGLLDAAVNEKLRNSSSSLNYKNPGHSEQQFIH
jgi:hypothetical protein